MAAVEKAQTPPKARRWRSVKPGEISGSANDLRRALKENGVPVNRWAGILLARLQFEAGEAKQECDLALLTPAMLGFESKVPLRVFLDRAFKLGYRLCPSWVGPKLRIDYQDQPWKEEVVVAMVPIVDSTNQGAVFALWHDENGLWLGAQDGEKGTMWRPDTLFVLVCPSD